MEKTLAAIKNAGMRKIVWGLVALLSISVLCFGRRLAGGEFVTCFSVLVGSVMAANGFEHKSKQEAKSSANVPPVA
jgi:hypothetical protein